MNGTRILSQSEAHECLAPYAEGLRESVEEAFRHYVTHVMPVLGQVSRRTRASVLHDLTLQRLRARWEDRVLRRFGRELLQLRPDVLLQVKKLDADRLPRNYATRAADQFARQLPLPGMQPVTRLTLGYRINQLGTEIVEITVLCTRTLRHVSWYYDLTDLVAPIKQLVLPEVEPKKRRLKAKHNAKRGNKKSRQN